VSGGGTASGGRFSSQARPDRTGRMVWPVGCRASLLRWIFIKFLLVTGLPEHIMPRSCFAVTACGRMCLLHKLPLCCVHWCVINKWVGGVERGREDG